jgi:thiol-disulfide isomerase/thioredoxin
LGTAPPRRRLRALAVALLFAVMPAAAFDLVDTQGRHHRLAELKGRWVVVNFWATWCVPCIEEIPEVAAFARAHREVEIVGVATDVEDVAKVKRFAAKVGHDYALVLSNEKVEKALGHVKALPTTRIYDPQGAVVYDKAGRVDRRLLERLTQRPTPNAALKL